MTQSIFRQYPGYPSYPTQPAGGDLPTMVEMGPPDMRATSHTAPAYQALIDRRYGRMLAGTDIDVQDEGTDQAWASNELALLAEGDDVQANGIFDPPGSSPNIYPDAGVFAGRFSLPGYHARERPWSQSEVRDATTGRPIVAVPSGAVAIDSVAEIAHIEQGLYQQPKQILNYLQSAPMQKRSIANWMQNPIAIGADAVAVPPKMTGLQMLGVTVAVGLAAGAVYAVMKGGKKGRK